MNRCTLVSSMAHSGATWTDKLFFAFTSLDRPSQAEAPVRPSTQVSSTGCYGVRKHLQFPAQLADIAV